MRKKITVKKIISILKHKKRTLFFYILNRLIYYIKGLFLYIYFSFFKKNINPSMFSFSKKVCLLNDLDLKILCDNYSEITKLLNDEAGGLWTHIIEDYYKEFSDNLVSHNYSSLRELIQEIGTQSFTIGLSLSSAVPKNIFEKGHLLKSFDFYHKIYNKVSLNKNVIFPTNFGHFHGLKIGKDFFQISSFRHNYYAEKISSLLKVKNGNIIEIGGGYGGVCYQLFKSFKFKGTYIMVDLPIMLINTVVFLQQALPNKKIKFVTNLDEFIFENYDIVLIPNNLYSEKIIKNVAVAFNAHSFTEMDFSTTKMYLDSFIDIEPEFIYSFNHNLEYEYYDKGKLKKLSSLDNKEFSSIIEKKYNLINRFPELLQGESCKEMLYDQKAYFEYLWIKTSSQYK